MKAIISASRRTDLPRFHLQRTLDAFKAGSIELINPFNQQPYTVKLDKDEIACIVWWSKDYSAYLSNPEAIAFFSKFNQVFQFTINGYSDPMIARVLEPGITSDLETRIGQARQLAAMYSPKQVLWRFDPIVFWADDAGEHNNLGDLPVISQALGKFGVERCHVAFADQYAKFKKRASNRFADLITFHVEPLESRRHIARNIATFNKHVGIKTYSCAHDEIVDEPAGVLKAHCIDADLIDSLFGGDVSHAKDQGQRESCGCVASKDIGRYDQKCKHCCIYCYANPDDT